MNDIMWLKERNMNIEMEGALNELEIEELYVLDEDIELMEEEEEE